VNYIEVVFKVATSDLLYEIYGSGADISIGNAQFAVAFTDLGSEYEISVTISSSASRGEPPELSIVDDIREAMGASPGPTVDVYYGSELRTLDYYDVAFIVFLMNVLYGGPRI
jgi:hypothetical protein